MNHSVSIRTFHFKTQPDKSMKCTLQCKAVPGRGSLLTKLLLVMRITAIFILGVSLHVSANSFSQSITISAKKITIEKAFRLIEQQTDFSFLWNESVLDKSRVISIDVKDAPLSTALDICLRGLPLSYRIIDRMVLIGLTRVLRSEDSVRSALYPLADIHGRILNENGEPLAGATVAIKGTTITSLTDEQGNFHINTGDQLKPILQISFVGYLTEEYPLRGRDNFTIKLRQDIRSVGDVV